jgi:hypothetical protein
MYLDQVIRLYQHLDLAEVKPCTPDRVNQLEQQLGFQLPMAYREFLLWAGNKCSDLSPFGEEIHLESSSDYVQRLRHINGKQKRSDFPYRRFTNESEESAQRFIAMMKQQDAHIEVLLGQLPSDAFVIAVKLIWDGFNYSRLGQTFFVRLSEGQDPPVYLYEPVTQQTVCIAKTFSEVLLEEVVKHEKQLSYLQNTYGLNKPIRQTHYLDEVKARYGAVNFPSPDPCTIDEVLRLERRHGFAFPDAFREFLLWGGHWAEVGMMGSEFFYPQIYGLKADARYLLAENSYPEPLPEDAVVFFMHQGYQFAFTRPSTGEESHVFYFNESLPEKGIHRTGTLAEFLLAHIEWIARLKQENIEADRKRRENKGK